MRFQNSYFITGLKPFLIMKNLLMRQEKAEFRQLPRHEVDLGKYAHVWKSD